MSDCGKASRIAQQMASVPSVPTVDTEYVAKLLAEEASRRKKSYDSIGIAAYTVCAVYSCQACADMCLLNRKPFPILLPKKLTKLFSPTLFVK